MAQNLVILGATGSVGASTLDLVRQHPARWQVLGLSGYKNTAALIALCREFKPRFVAVPYEAMAQTVRSALTLDASFELPQFLLGEQGLDALAQLAEADFVIAAITGAAGLSSTLAAAQAGKTIVLANKEALVVGGPWLKAACLTSGATLLPIDSEHNALFQCLPDGKGKVTADVKALCLTASGGFFLNRPLETFAAITAQEAVAHPNWSMGQKISVDSATMANKGLELMEARWLFDVAPSQLSAVIHPQSIVHSWVEYLDGSCLAHLSNPDMRIPIAHALAFPERVTTQAKPLDLKALAALSFQAIDADRFPCFALAQQALARSHATCVIFNAANEIAVARFLAGEILFTEIAKLIAAALGDKGLAAMPCATLEQALALDAATRSRS